MSIQSRMDRRMRAMLSPERYAAWRERQDRWRTCAHRFDRPRWAGILGWRDDCSKCGHMFVPHEHEECTTCEYHPKERDDDDA